eukprot:795708-Rhodomonas_salina.1
MLVARSNATSFAGNAKECVCRLKRCNATVHLLKKRDDDAEFTMEKKGNSGSSRSIIKKSSNGGVLKKNKKCVVWRDCLEDTRVYWEN